MSLDARGCGSADSDSGDDQTASGTPASSIASGAPWAPDCGVLAQRVADLGQQFDFGRAAGLLARLPSGIDAHGLDHQEEDGRGDHDEADQRIEERADAHLGVADVDHPGLEVRDADEPQEWGQDVLRPARSTMAPNAAPMTTATARSTTLPRSTKSRNSLITSPSPTALAWMLAAEAATLVAYPGRSAPATRLDGRPRASARSGSSRTANLGCRCPVSTASKPEVID